MIDNYELTVDGVLRQIKIEKESSNSSLNLAKNCHYFNYYNSFDEKPMNELRYNLMVSDMTKEEIYHLCILDFGYGSGTFVKYCFELGNDTYGYDIADTKLSHGTKINDINIIFEEEFEIVTFFDSLEHCEDIEFIKNINTEYILISVPWCHWKKEGDEWFMNWKHRKPNEHLYHFDDISLKKFMKRMGFSCIKIGNFEDVIRKSIDHRKNILTGLFKKMKKEM
tara:strand:- start:449 stop:1120 length:672 start_codon:yes stop_codon:yes gene_type:complete